MATFRTPEMQARYLKVLAERVNSDTCPLCGAASIQEFELWRIVENMFPYDRIASIHHMLLPKRHAAERDLTPEELSEFARIKQTHLQENYEFLIEPTYKMKSIPAHMHIHMVVAKD